MSEVDPVVGIITLLKADATVNALVAGRVFGDELPSAETVSMPRKCIVVEPSGGTQSFGRAYQDYSDGRFDIRSYGETPYQAGVVARAVHTVLKHLRREVHGGVLLHWAMRSAGPISLRDPDTNWPFRFESWQVLASEKEIA